MSIVSTALIQLLFLFFPLEIDRRVCSPFDNNSMFLSSFLIIYPIKKKEREKLERDSRAPKLNWKQIKNQKT